MRWDLLIDGVAWYVQALSGGRRLVVDWPPGGHHPGLPPYLPQVTRVAPHDAVQQTVVAVQTAVCVGRLQTAHNQRSYSLVYNGVGVFRIS